VIARLPGPKSSTVTLDDRFGKMGNFRRTTAFSEANLNLRNIYLQVGIPLAARQRQPRSPPTNFQKWMTPIERWQSRFRRDTGQ
jgi:hypothetical protein